VAPESSVPLESLEKPTDPVGSMTAPFDTIAVQDVALPTPTVAGTQPTVVVVAVCTVLENT
jgi:hypothetical protein